MLYFCNYFLFLAYLSECSGSSDYSYDFYQHSPEFEQLK